MSKTKAIIFDLWGTLVETGVKPSPSRQVKYFLRVNEAFPDFIMTFEHSFMTQKFESLTQGFEQVVKDFNLRIPEFVYEKLVGMWNKNVILSKLYEDVEPNLKNLKEQGYKLFLIANTDQFSFEQVLEKHKLQEYFDGIYPSHETGLLKVNPESYEKILKDNKLKKDEVLMIGDSVHSDMDSAEKAGIKGLLIDRKNNREYENKILDLNGLQEVLK